MRAIAGRRDCVPCTAVVVGIGCVDVDDTTRAALCAFPADRHTERASRAGSQRDGKATVATATADALPNHAMRSQPEGIDRHASGRRNGDGTGIAAFSAGPAHGNGDVGTYGTRAAPVTATTTDALREDAARLGEPRGDLPRIRDVHRFTVATTAARSADGEPST